MGGPPPPLFSGQRQYEAFSRIREFTPVAGMAASSHPFAFGDGPRIDLPETYVHEGETRSLRGLFETTDTSALLVLKDGAVRFEDYWLTGGREVQWISMSVAKSFISALIGIALEEGRLNSLDDAISDYVPGLRGSGYDGVSIRHVLQMSSGVRWREDYADPDSEISRMSAALAPGGSLDLGDDRGVEGIAWLMLLQQHFPHSIWLNPEPRRHWTGNTIEYVRRVFDMYPLTLAGLGEGVTRLMRGGSGAR